MVNADNNTGEDKGFHNSCNGQNDDVIIIVVVHHGPVLAVQTHHSPIHQRNCLS